ncbi:TPA: hypothetical protein ACH3X2_009128 [Trebouxia sp. C0005]
MAPKKSKSAKAEEQAEDAGVELQQAAPKDKSKVPGGKAGGAASAKRPESDRKASSKKAHANYADDGQEKQASKLLVEEDAQGDVKEAIAEGDKAADKIQAQVNKEDADFDPDNAAEDEVEAVPDDEADDAGDEEEEMADDEVAAEAEDEDAAAGEVEDTEAPADDDLEEDDEVDDEEDDYEEEKPAAKKAKGAAGQAAGGKKGGQAAKGKSAAGKTAAAAKGGKNNGKVRVTGTLLPV